jgi:hypothetical protein
LKAKVSQRRNVAIRSKVKLDVEYAYLLLQLPMATRKLLHLIEDGFLLQRMMAF